MSGGLFSDYDLGGFYDEGIGIDGTPRPGQEPVVDYKTGKLPRSQFVDVNHGADGVISRPTASPTGCSLPAVPRTPNCGCRPRVSHSPDAGGSTLG